MPKGPRGDKHVEIKKLRVFLGRVGEDGVEVRTGTLVLHNVHRQDAP
jgi:hypothetical protein